MDEEDEALVHVQTVGDEEGRRQGSVLCLLELLHFLISNSHRKSIMDLQNSMLLGRVSPHPNRDWCLKMSDVLIRKYSFKILIFVSPSVKSMDFLGHLMGSCMKRLREIAAGLNGSYIHLYIHTYIYIYIYIGIYTYIAILSQASV